MTQKMTEADIKRFQDKMGSAGFAALKENDKGNRKHLEDALTGKFANVPKDEGTAIICQQETLFGDYPVLYQKWCWDGVVAESLIFANEDITGLSVEALTKAVAESPMNKLKSQITVKQSDSGFAFVNFNFEVFG